jgi:hypothetical protein
LKASTDPIVLCEASSPQVYYNSIYSGSSELREPLEPGRKRAMKEQSRLLYPTGDLSH